MKKNSIFFALKSIIILGGFFLFQLAKAEEAPFIKGNSSNKDIFIPNEVIVKFKNNKINLKSDFGIQKSKDLSTQKQLKIKKILAEGNIVLMKSEKGEDVDKIIDRLEKDPNVDYAEPNYIIKISAINTNDTYKQYLWGFDNTGQSVEGVSGSIDADVDLPEAWAISEGSENIVAVIDNGVYYNHPDLSGSLWDGTNCKDENGNYLGGCIHGYDFGDSDKDPAPSTAGGSHGTEVAGLITATRNNGRGILGVAPKTKLMALKASIGANENGSSITATVNSIDFAINNNVKIINFSSTTAYFSQSLYDAIKRFKDAGGIFITSAGNESNNIDLDDHSYPCEFDLDNIICVAATNQNDSLVSMEAGSFWGSNYGGMSVDLGAPGENILNSTNSIKTVLMAEPFESVSSPNIPAGFSKTGTWGTVATSDDKFGNMLAVDQGGPPYDNNADQTISSSTFDLSNPYIESTKIDFWAMCDTEYDTENWRDYLALEISKDGVNFEELDALDPFWSNGKFDEYILQFLNNQVTDGGEYGQGSYYNFTNIEIPEEYFTSNFKFRFRWVSDSSDNNYFGCAVDNIYLRKYYATGEDYEFASGTSFASPIVAGAVALVWGYRPGQSYQKVRSLILDNGDTLPSLIGKTVTGKRLNIKKSLQAVDVSPPIISGVSNGTRYNTNVAPTFNEGTATLNGTSFSSGTVIGNEGSFSLVVTDSSGNSTSISFSIDKTSPNVSGVSDGQTYITNVTPTFTEGSATLNGSAFSSGTTLSEDNNYNLILSDESGNSTNINFVIDKIATNSPILGYTKKKATKKINITLHGVVLDKKKKNVSVRIGGRKAKVLRVRNLNGQALVSVSLSRKKLPRGTHGLNLTYRKKQGKKWTRGNIITNNILRIQ